MVIWPLKMPKLSAVISIGRKKIFGFLNVNVKINKLAKQSCQLVAQPCRAKIKPSKKLAHASATKRVRVHSKPENGHVISIKFYRDIVRSANQTII